MHLAPLCRSHARRGVVGLALLILATTTTIARADDKGSPSFIERDYRVRFLPLRDASALAHNLCPLEGTCRIGDTPPDGLTVIADAATQEKIAHALQVADVPPVAQAFELILLQADRGAAEPPEALPAAARKALDDVAGFLPFTRYRSVGSGFVRTTRDARVVVDGGGDRAYEATIAFRGDARTAGGEIYVDHFGLRLVPADPIALLTSGASRTYGGTPRATAAGAAAPRPPKAPIAAPTTTEGSGPAPAPAATPGPTLAQTLIETTFSLHKGETIVVGTSRVADGNGALVVLLTALP